MREKGETSAVLPNFQDINLMPSKKRLLIFCFLIMTLTVFLYRVPVRYFTKNNDFTVLYLASLALNQGENPYDHGLLDRIWLYNYGPPAYAPTKESKPSLYPLSSYILISPFTHLPFNSAKQLLFGVNCLAILGIFLVSLKLAKLRYSDWRSILLWALFIGLAPLQNVVFMGHFVLLVVLFLLLSIWAYISNLDILSGILLAIGLCLKPQLAIFFFIYYIISGNFKIYLSCTLTTLLIFSLGIIKLGLNNFSWLVSWQDNLRCGMETVNNPSPINPTRHTFLNLQYPLETAFQNDILIYLLIFSIMVVAFIMFIKYFDNSKNNYNVLINMSFISTITLLPFYHRNYDASLLVIPLTISILLFNTQYAKIGKFSLILMLFFLAPSSSIALKLSEYFGFESNNAFFLNFIILPHQVWILLILSGVFLYLMFLKKSQGCPSRLIS